MSRSEPLIEPYEDGPEVAADEEAKRDALAVVHRAHEIVVSTQETLTVANNWLVEVKTIRRRIDAEFDPGIKDSHALHQRLIAQKKKWTGVLDEAETLLRPKIAAYLQEQDRLRLAAERAAQLAKEAIEAEARKATDKAHALIDEGHVLRAEKVVAKAAAKIEALEASMPTIPDKVTAEGTSLVERWDWDREVADLSLVPVKYLKLDDAKVTAYVRTFKHQAVIPGIRIFKTVTTATRITK